MLRFASFCVVAFVFAMFACETKANDWQRYRESVARRTNQQLRNGAIVSHSIQSSLNRLQYGWPNHGNHYYYHNTQPHTIYHGNHMHSHGHLHNNWHPNHGGMHSWGQPNGVYIRW
jgi:hypothetical protein